MDTLKKGIDMQFTNTCHGNMVGWATVAVIERTHLLWVTH